MTGRAQDEDEEWGPWLRHDGKGCPVRIGTIVEVVCEDRFGFTMCKIARVEGGAYSSWDWAHFPELKKIIRYREKRPRGLGILEASLAALKTTRAEELIEIG